MRGVALRPLDLAPIGSVSGGPLHTPFGLNEAECPAGTKSQNAEVTRMLWSYTRLMPWSYTCQVGGAGGDIV